MAVLSVQQAAAQAHTTGRTVRRWIAEGKLPATRHADGWTVADSDLVAMLDARADARPTTASQVRPSDSDDWRQYVADLRRQLEVKDAQISELHTLLAQAQRALPPASKMDPISGSSASAGVETVHQAHQRPWWRRWFLS